MPPNRRTNLLRQPTAVSPAASPDCCMWYANVPVDDSPSACPAVDLLLQAHRSVDLSEQQYKELDDKLSRLSQAEGWGVDALFALDASSTLVQYSFLTATDEDAVALVNELLQKRGKCVVRLLGVSTVPAIFFWFFQRPVKQGGVSHHRSRV